MKTPDWVNKELRAIDPAYFAVYEPRANRWLIRKFRIRFPLKRDYTYPYCDYVSDFILKVCKEDEDGRDIGYQDFDMRPILAIKISNYNKNRMKKFIQEIDDSNARLTRSFDVENELMARDLAKQIYHYYNEPTIYMR